MQLVLIYPVVNRTGTWLWGLDMAECNIIGVIFCHLKMIFLSWKRLTWFLDGHILDGVCTGTQGTRVHCRDVQGIGHWVNMCNYNDQSLPGDYFLLLSLWCPAAIHIVIVFVDSWL